MKKLSSEFKFYLFGFGIPLLLVLFWAGKDTVQLASNYWKIRQTRRDVAKLTLQKQRLEAQLAALQKNDSAAWEKLLRESRALKPNEVEYRFK